MCLGIPGLIVDLPPSPEGWPEAVVEFAGVRRRVCLACVPEAQVGDYVLVHAGMALSNIDPAEAARVFSYLREMGETGEWADPEPPPCASLDSSHEIS